MPDYVDVAVPLGVRKTFAYSVPEFLRDRIAVGARVLVPFGRRLLTGIVVTTSKETPAGDFRLRAIRELLDPQPIVPPGLIATACWVAEHYFAPLGEVLRALFPVGTQVTGLQRVRLSPHAEKLLGGGLRPHGLSPKEESLLDHLAREGAMSLKQLKARAGLRDASQWIEALAAGNWIEIESHLLRARVGAKEQLGIRWLPADQATLAAITPAQRRLYESLSPGVAPLPLQEASRRAGTSLSVAKSLARKGLVGIESMRIHRLPIDLTETSQRKVLALTDAQSKVLEALRTMVDQRQPVRCLLHGVTGSGKTEIYLRLIADVLKVGGSALFLVPEIGLTPLLSRIAVSHFPEQVALLHSAMSSGERFDQWNRIRASKAPVVVGTRSAVFAPMENLRLIIIDEEQDTSYKQDESPCYHAREVAWQRIQQSSGLLLMGSATPSVETYHAARETGEVRYLCLAERIEARPLPEVTVLDMSLEFQRHGKRTIISQTLLAELQERLRRKEQAIVLLNRRGYSRSLLCRTCGQVSVCPECSISMTYHQGENLLICHYCGAEKSIPSACANCGGEYIYFVGVGTEQLEELLGSLLPKARLARLDRDTTRRRGALRKILLDFAAGRLDILVGTQILAKGHDFPNVTLVGVVGADAGLAFPDFRSAERTFQLLTQVAGRTGRGEMPGRVIIQSYYPDHYALRFSRMQDYLGFFAHEIEFRRALGYPPLTSLIQILVTDRSSAKAFQIGEKVAAALKAILGKHNLQRVIRLLGPAAAPLEKLRGKHRVQLLLKISPGLDVIPALRAAFGYLAQCKVPLKNVHVDVDPLSLM